uniref:Uncharacterized protein n=1 Tax=Oryza rufipogon TaxID=4529 RepID=A0A0E0PLF8_ORYRU
MLTDNKIGGVPVVEGPNKFQAPPFFDSGNGLVKPPLTCSPDASLGSVIDSIASRITHRIYTSWTVTSRLLVS